MPIVSTLAGASLPTMWKKGSEVNSCDSCCCSCHQRPTRMAACAGGGLTREDIMQRQQAAKTQKPPPSAVRRTPFRSLNGRAYAVPLTMIKEFDAVFQQAQNSAAPQDRTSPLFLPLNSPGILWRHDPYSTRVLSATSHSPVNRFSTTEKGAGVAPYEGGRGSGCGGCGGCGEGEPTGYWNGTGNPFTACDSAALNSVCAFTPTSAPLGAVLCFPATGGMRIPGVNSAFSQPYDTTPLLHQHYTDPYNIVAAVAGDCGEQLRNQQSTVESIMPSSRPLPSAPSHCVIIRSPSQLTTSAVPPDAATGSRRVPAPATAETTAPTAVQKFDSFQAGPRGITPLRTHGPRGARSGSTDHNGEELLEDCLPTLSIFRSLPLLFIDLAAHTNRRPPQLGKMRDENGSQLRLEEVRFVFLVGHRCRRTVCAATLRYEVGEMVVLEGDMGIEMGVVQAVLSVEEFDQLGDAELEQSGFPADRDVVTAALILRHATAEEVAHYNHTLLLLARDLLGFLQHRLNPANFVDCRVANMEFLDCEFQADCKKIYVYYKAKKRVLFRELAQYLHSFYRCRIWLHEVGKRASALSGDSSQETEG